MLLKELKPILSSYNRYSLRIYEVQTCIKELQIDNLKHFDSEYDNYHVTKIETSKTNCLTLRLEKD